MDLRHYDHDGRARFLTFCTHERRPIVSNARFRDIVVDCILESRSEFGFRLLAFVVMPEHVHLVIVPREDAEAGRIVGEIKSRSARRIHELLRGSPLEIQLMVDRNGVRRFALWQRRCFDHNCRTPEKVCEKVRYCIWNPVARGLVGRPEDWPWSSAGWDVNSEAAKGNRREEPS